MPLTVTHAKSNTLGDFTGTATVFNSAGTTTTVLATDLIRPSDWNSAHVYTVGLTGSEIASLFNFGSGLSSTTGAGGVTVALGSVPWIESFPLVNTNSTLSAPGIGTWYFDGPYELDFAIAGGQLNGLVSNAAGFVHGTSYSAASTGSLSYFATFYNQLALYKLGTGASTSRLESFSTFNCSLIASQIIRLSTANTSSGTISNALTLSFPSQFNSSGGVTYGSTAQSGTSQFGTSTAASTYANNLITGAVAYISGARMDMVGVSSTVPAGAYWLAHMFTSTSSTAGTAGGIGNGTLHTMFQAHSRLGLLENLVNAYHPIGVSISNSSTNVQPFHGYLATTTSAATSIVNTGDIRGTTGRMYWNYLNSTY